MKVQGSKVNSAWGVTCFAGKEQHTHASKEIPAGQPAANPPTPKRKADYVRVSYGYFPYLVQQAGVLKVELPEWPGGG